MFEAPGRTGHQSRGYSGDWDEALNVVSNYGKIGLSIDWGGGAGGRNTRTELATKFFDGYYNFSRCIQEAFGGPRSDSWENEEVALRFIDWAANVNSISDIIKATPLKKNKDLFNKLKTFIVEWTLAIEELAKDPKYKKDDDKGWWYHHNIERTVAEDAIKSVNVPEELLSLGPSEFNINDGNLWVAGKWVHPIFRETTSGEIKCFWQQSSNGAPKPLKTPDDLANWIGAIIKFTSKFDPNTFLS